MAFYQGETGRVWAVPLNYDGKALLTDADVDAFITIYDDAGDEVLTETAMVFTATAQRPLRPGETSSSGVGYWYYDWSTAAEADENANFLAKVRVAGGIIAAKEYLRFRLSKNPV